jgi:hypothetical protein
MFRRTSNRPPASTNPIARAIVGWLESAAPLAPGAGATAGSAGLACCGAAADQEPTGAPRRRHESWIAK